MRWAISWFVMTALFLATLPATTQDQPATPTFKSHADLVLVPVIVRDKHGSHVSGLTAADFVIQQDGTAQRITSAEEIAAGTAPAQPVAPPEGSFSNQSATAQQPQELIIFAIDLVNTPFLDVDTARKAVLKFLATQLKPNQTVGLVTIERTQVHLLHAFTTSPSVLSAALQKVTGVTAVPELPENLMVSATAERLAQFAQAKEQLAENVRDMNLLRQQYNVATALDSLRQIAYWVGGIPGRKILFWVTGHVPWATIRSPDREAKKGGGGSAYEDYVFTIQTLASNNVALYPVDVRGLLTDWNDAIYLGPGSDVFNQVLRGGVAGRSATLRLGVYHLETSHAAMNIMADATGGRAFYNRNDIPKLFQNAADDSSRYYMLSYYLDRKQSQPGWHKLKVTVDEKGLTARARTGFYVSKAAENNASLREADENTALASPFEYTALPITLKWKDTQAGIRKAQFEVNIPPAAAVVDAENNSVDLDFLAVATAANAEVAGRSTRNVHATLGPASIQQIATNGITYVSDLELKPGQYAVRLVVRDNLTGRLGSITAPLTVSLEATR